MKKITFFALFATSFFFLSSCSPDIVAPPCDKGVCVVEQSQGVHVVAVVASAENQWVYLKLDGLKEVQNVKPTTDQEWDLAFQRYRIISNGGESGSGGRKVAILKEKEFEEVTTIPKEGFKEDKKDENGDGDPDSVFLQEGSWYDYDLGKHLLLPKKRVYVVSSKGKFYKIKIRSYYSSLEKSGTPSLLVSELK